MWRFASVAVLRAASVGFLLGVVGCGGAETSVDVVPGSEVDDSLDEPPPEPPVVGELLNVRLSDNPTSGLSLHVEAETSAPARVQVLFGLPGGPRASTPETVLGTSHFAVPVAMRAEETYEIEVRAVFEDGTVSVSAGHEYTTAPLPDWIPAFDVHILSPELVQPGITLFSQMPHPTLQTRQGFGVDESGHVVWYLDLFEGGSSGGIRQGWDGLLEVPMGSGLLAVTPGGEIRARYPLAAPFTVHHDALRLPDGSAALLSDQHVWGQVPGIGEANILDDVVFEVDPAGVARRIWDGWGSLDRTRFPGPLSLQSSPIPGYEGVDWTHANGLAYDPGDDTLLISVRNQNWIVKVRRDTGEIVWRLGDGGDFTLSEGGLWFYSQHNPTLLPDGTLLLFDNGNERPVGEGELITSRAVQYHLDVDTMVATQVNQWDVGELHGFLGSAQQLDNGNVLLCAGAAEVFGPPGPQRARILEMTSDEPKKVVWELEFETHAAYRATRVVSLVP